MFRSPVQIRDAAPDDALALVEVWGGAADRAPDVDAASSALQEAGGSITRISADPEERLLVAFVDDHAAGAVHLKRGQLSPIHGEAAVYVMHLQVIEGFRRHGVGRALMEATVSWAEETARVLAHRRRRLGHLPRRQPVHGKARPHPDGRGPWLDGRGPRAKLPVDTLAAARVGSRTHRSVSQVLVQRRSMRRSQARPS